MKVIEHFVNVKGIKVPSNYHLKNKSILFQYQVNCIDLLLLYWCGMHVRILNKMIYFRQCEREWQRDSLHSCSVSLKTLTVRAAWWKQCVYVCVCGVERGEVVTVYKWWVVRGDCECFFPRTRRGTLATAGTTAGNGINGKVLTDKVWDRFLVFVIASYGRRIIRRLTIS